MKNAPTMNNNAKMLFRMSDPTVIHVTRTATSLYTTLYYRTTWSFLKTVRAKMFRPVFTAAVYRAIVLRTRLERRKYRSVTSDFRTLDNAAKLRYRTA